MADQTLNLEVRMENGQFKVSSKQVESGVKGIGKETAKTNKTLDKMGLALKGVAVGAGVALIAFFKKSIRAASDLQEISSKFRTVFKGNMDIASQAVKDLTENYGMSTREAREYMSSIQDLLVPMGMMPEAAAKMSAEVVKLSGDLGSFNNLPTAQVMADIQSALVGNFETMKKYGIVLNETVLKQEALRQKVWDGKGAIDAATKAQVAYDLVVKGSQSALGDMARTAGSYANTMKRLGAAFEDAAASAGNSLLPVLSKVASAATRGLRMIEESFRSTERSKRAIVKLEKMKARMRWDEMSTLEQIKWTHRMLNQLLSHELWLEKQLGKEKDKKKSKKPDKGPVKARIAKLKKEAPVPHEVQAEIDFAETYKRRARILENFNGMELTLAEQRVATNRALQKQGAAEYEAHLQTKLGMDSVYYAGLQTVASVSGVFMAEKNKKLFKFGQGLAVAQTIMSGQQGAIKAYAQLGPIAGVAGAAIIAAATTLSVRKILTQKPPEYAVGSFNVPSTSPAIVHQGEMILPKTMAESVRSGDAVVSSGGGQQPMIIQVDGKTLFEVNEQHRDEAVQNIGSTGSFPIDSPY